MTAQEMLTKAKAQLILSEPFFAILALKMNFVEEKSIKTMRTDGNYVWYNPNFVNSLFLDEVKGVIAHEVMHPALFHHTRRGMRDRKKWNKACDYAINPLLLDAGFILPEGFLVDDNYREMPAEQIYNLLPEGDDNEGDDDEDDPGGCGSVIDNPSQGQAEKAEEESEMRESLQQAVNAGEKWGKLPNFIKRAIQDSLHPKVDWKEVLARFLAEPCRDDYTFRKPNPRYLGTGFYLPYLQNETVGEIVMVVDTSGSINEKLLNDFGTEMQSVANTFGKGFKVIYVDSEVQNIEDVEPDGAVDLHPSGGGGTDFKPAYEWLEKEGIVPKALVYFTDGVCNSFPEPSPDYPTLWAIYGKHNFEPPFGEVVNIIE